MITVLGANGYIGSSFVDYLRYKGIPYTALKGRSECNLLDKKELTKKLKKINPSFVINAAGYTGKPNVDACELDKEATHEGNVVLPMNVGEACKSIGVPWGHISSGCIYNGYDKEYTEEDEPNFTHTSEIKGSYYSGTKAEAEKRITESFSDCFIWRLRIPFNSEMSKRNYLYKVLNYSTLLDVQNSVSHKDDFVRVCVSLWLSERQFGIYNVVNTGSVTSRQVVEMFKDKYGDSLNKHWKFMTDIDEFYKEIKPAAPRSNCVLSNQKLIDSGVKIRTVHEAFYEAIGNWSEVIPGKVDYV